MKIKTVLLLLLCFVNLKLLAKRDTLSISFQSEKHTIKGKVIIPDAKSTKMPAVIFLVGSGGKSSHSTNYADFVIFFLEESLLSQGIALVYFDKRGIGQSEGVWYKTNFEQRALDVKNAAEYLKTLTFIDPEKLFLVGHSQGGWITQICMAQYSDIFAGGISMAGATFGVKKQLINDYHSKCLCINNLESEHALEKAQNKVNQILTLTTLLPLKQNWKQLKRIRKFEAQPYLTKIKKPILFMWGDNDKLVSSEWCMTELKTIFANEIPDNFQMYVGEGENHSFKKSSFCYNGKSKDLFYSEETRKKIVDWLLTHINKLEK